MVKSIICQASLPVFLWGFLILLAASAAGVDPFAAQETMTVTSTKTITIGPEGEVVMGDITPRLQVGSAGGDKNVDTCSSTGECVESDANTSTVSSSSNTCLDDKPVCPNYAARGDCEKNPRYMLAHCKFSCNACPKNLEFVVTEWGEPQEASGKNADKIKEVIRETEEYMLNKVFKRALYISVRDKCINKEKLCSTWAQSGECKANPHFMQIQCAPACKSCEQIDQNIRCPVNDRAPKAWSPGSVDEMFERLTTHPDYKKYNPVALSRPPTASTGIVPAVHNSKLPDNDAPWVVTLENFLTDEECNRLIRLGADQGYEQSYAVGRESFDGSHTPRKSEARTSNNAWCKDECYDDAITKQVLAKIENVTGIPDTNSEFLQLLRYKKSQRYETHHDYVPSDFDRAQGVRIMTVFLYLNDVEEGGETNFPTLGITVKPKKGHALIWPNVYMLNPDAKDARTIHQALPVEGGVKYAANAWIHQRDFKSVYFRNCNY